MKVQWLILKYLFISLILYFVSTIFFELNMKMLLGPLEYSCYASYPYSLIRDGDLNIINQLRPQFSWIATSHFFDVDFHDYGIVSLITPFFYLGKALAGSDNFNFNFYERIYCVFNIVIFGLSLGLINKITQSLIEDDKGQWLKIILFSLNIPLCWYAFGHINGSDIAAVFLLSLIIYFYLEFQEKNNTQTIISQMFIFLISCLTKITIIFSGVLFFYEIFRSRMNKKYVFQILGLGVLTATLIGGMHANYLITKFGMLFHGHSSYLTSHFFVLYETVFSENGYLISSPVYWFTLIGAGALFCSPYKDLKHRGFLLFMFCAFILRLILISYRPIEDELFGSRMIMLDSYLTFPLALIGMKFVFKKKYRVLSLMTLFFGLCYSAYIFGIYINDPDSWSSGYNFSSISFQHGYAYILSSFKSLPFKNIFFTINWPLLIIIITGVAFVACLLRQSIQKTLIIIATYMFLNFSLAHFLNQINYRKNIQAMTSQGLFKDKVITKGPRSFIYDDFTSVFVKSIYYAEKRNRPEDKKRREEILQQYYLDIKPEIIFDPIHFIKDMELGHYRRSGHFD